MKREYAEQERYNRFKERARRVISIEKGQVWEVSKTILNLFEGKFIQTIKVIKILGEPYQGVCRISIDGVEKDAIGLEVELLKYKARIIKNDI